MRKEDYTLYAHNAAGTPRIIDSASPSEGGPVSKVPIPIVERRDIPEGSREHVDEIAVMVGKWVRFGVVALVDVSDRDDD